MHYTYLNFSVIHFPLQFRHRIQKLMLLFLCPVQNCFIYFNNHEVKHYAAILFLFNENFLGTYVYNDTAICTVFDVINLQFTTVESSIHYRLQHTTYNIQHTISVMYYSKQQLSTYIICICIYILYHHLCNLNYCYIYAYIYYYCLVLYIVRQR